MRTQPAPRSQAGSGGGGVPRSRSLAALATALLFGLGSLSLGATPAQAAEVSVPDAAFAACLRAEVDLELGEDTLTADTLGALTEVYCAHQNVAVLTGAQYLVKVDWLDLQGNAISNLSPLAGLTSLTGLQLGDNEIIDVSPLAGLSALTELDLYENEIVDVSPLAGLTALTELDLTSNCILDVSPLGALDEDGLSLGQQDISRDVIEGVPTAFPLRNLNGELPSEVEIPWAWSILDGMLTAFTKDTYDPDGDDDPMDMGFTDKGSSFSGSLDITVTPGTVNRLTTHEPTITGSLVAGQTLTISMEAWEPAPVTYAYEWTRGDEETTVGTAATYTLTSKDVGEYLTVWVGGMKQGYLSEWEVSDATGTVAKDPSVKKLTSAVPKISGPVRVGATLTASPGTWKPAPVGLAYQWQRDGVDIGDATGKTYVPTTADLGRRLQVAVTGTKAGYDSVTKVSKKTGKVATGRITTVVPTISGTPIMGNYLIAVSDPWSPASVQWTAVQWLRSGKAIKGAVDWFYQVAPADVGKRLSVRLTGTADGYAAASRTSKETSKVKAGVLDPAPDPVVSGIARVGETLTLDRGSWASSVAVSQQWYRSDKKISKETGLTHVLTAADLGKRISVTVTARQAGYATVTKKSVPTEKVSAGVLSPTPTPAITGTAQAGQVLTVAPGTWGPAPVKLAVQWYRDAAKVKKATKLTFTPTAGDVGHTFTVRVTGSKSGYISVTVESAATQAVEPA